jgi:hypothetical protein
MFIEGVSAVKTGSAPANQDGLVEGVRDEPVMLGLAAADVPHHFLSHFA